MSAEKIEKLCLRAQQAIQQRDWEKAKQSYLMALGLKSDLPDVHYGLATVYFQLRELTSAAHHFREVTRLDPLRAGAYVNLGAVLNLLNQLDDAQAALRRGIQLDPQRVEGYYNLGLVHRRKGQIDLSIQAYREALRLNPRMADACHNLGNLYLEKQQLRQAVQFYQEALKIRPNWDKAVDGLAHAQALLSGEHEQQDLSKAEQPAAPAADDLNRVVDPIANAPLLTEMHQTTVRAEEAGRKFQKILEEGIEPAIKELSSCLLYPDGPVSELDTCIAQFEKALQDMRLVQGVLQNNMTRLRTMAEHFPEVS